MVKPKTAAAVCAVLAACLPVIFITLGENLVPDLIKMGVENNLREDTQAKLDDWLEPE
tara:strand:- start:624 stop:797 length:174 start_codon:yes stop_codon:yes gene_type:complete